jgi:acetyl esterase/lipase
VPIGYLIGVAIPAVVTAAALAPVPRSWKLGQLCWRLTFQINELPVLVACWVLAATALAAAQGDLGTPGGLAGAAVAVLTLAGLAVVLGRALQAGRAAAQALTDGLGPGWTAAVDPQRAGRLTRRRPWLRLLFAPLAVRRRDVVRQANLSYGRAGRRNLLDVYIPRSGTVSGPCLVHFHGGGYYSGRKNREARALIYRLASQGWVCISANYRRAGEAAFPAALVDAKRVIAWMREHASAYGADPSTIVVAGSSAGAHLAAMVALTPNSAALQPGFDQADTHVCAAICLYGFYGSPTWIDREPGAPSAPIALIRRGAPPMLVVHGTHDSFVPVSDARGFVERFRNDAPDTPLVYLELPGAQHTFDLYRSVRFEAVTDAAALFTARVFSDGQSCRARIRGAGMGDEERPDDSQSLHA